MLVHYLYYSICNLSAAVYGQLYRIGIIGIFIADKTQIYEWQAGPERLSGYYVVER